MTLAVCWDACAFGSQRTWYAHIMLEKETRLTHAQKYVKGKPCKPYNSVLGEFFRVGKTPNFAMTR